MAIDPREIQLTPEQRRQLASLAEQSGKDWPQLLAELLASFRPVADKPQGNGVESLCDALKRDGYLAAVAGGPADMSTNPQYMEGFGQSQ